MEKAHATYEFDKGFLLDEEKLRKINNIIKERIASNQSIKNKNIEYKIYRSDSFYFITESIDDILAEENSNINRIERIVFELQEKDIIEFELDFDNKTHLKIHGNDRDFIFLLFSDIKTYLLNEINTVKFISKETLLKICVVLCLLALILTLKSGYDGISPLFKKTDITKILESSDINEKLNFLIKRKTTSPINVSTYDYVFVFLAGVAVFILLFRKAIIKLYIYLFPINIFIWGKQKDNYQFRVNLKAKIFWAVCVGFFISLLAGIITWLITSQK